MLGNRYNGLFHFKTQINVLIGLIFSLVIDLHLSYPMPRFENHEKFLGEMKGIVSNHHSTWARRTEPTKEERRTILGCFYIFSTVSCPASPEITLTDCHSRSLLFHSTSVASIHYIGRLSFNNAMTISSPHLKLKTISILLVSHTYNESLRTSRTAGSINVHNNQILGM